MHHVVEIIQALYMESSRHVGHCSSGLQLSAEDRAYYSYRGGTAAFLDYSIIDTHISGDTNRDPITNACSRGG
jgi:hypothetical protein